ncbi:hypothetical protein Tco_1238765 [Tanacetum coccineum]
MHILKEPFFFLTNNTCAPQGDELGRMKPLSWSSLSCPDNSSISEGGNPDRLHDDLEVTAAKVCVTTAKLKLVLLLVKIEENILSSYYCLYTVNAAGV